MSERLFRGLSYNCFRACYNLDSEAEVEKKLVAAEVRLVEISLAIKVFFNLGTTVDQVIKLKL